MFGKILIANRGVAACRIARTCRRLGIATVAVYSEADRGALHVAAADEAVCIGPARARESYLSIDNILAAALATGSDAVHPGFGFLSENAAFAEACVATGIVFVGPTPAQIRAFGLKHVARDLARAAGLRLAPGTGLIADAAEARRAAMAVGYPVMLKSTAGGGGIGMQLCAGPDTLDAVFARVTQQAASSFGNGGVFLERAITHGRHLEVQIFGDGAGGVVVMGERDCSAQRRNQKVIEETPASGLSKELRWGLHESARRLATSVDYANAGTVEFIHDIDAGESYFLEVNTRLQVEHGVTEEAYGIDLVEWMLLQAAGEALPEWPVAPPRYAIQARLYAEDPARGFQPASGVLTEVRLSDSVRVDTSVADGSEVPSFYDAMIATVIASGGTRKDALEKLRTALHATVLSGIETNLAYLRRLLDDGVMDEVVTTRTLEAFVFIRPAIRVVAPGLQTTLQDHPGRLGYWHVGVPPSGPMDDLSHRLANRALGNPPDAATLEITVIGPTLAFEADAIICLAGAAVAADLDGAPVAFWEPVAVCAGQTLSIGGGAPAGSRAYLAVRGGFAAPHYLASRATFTLGGFGGQSGRALMAGDILRIDDAISCAPTTMIPDAERPRIGTRWDIGVLDGPHGAPDFFTEADIAAFYAADWVVHYNSSRTGVRLIGPKPAWARRDGGEAGLHPSNIHDTAYAIGAVDFTGDMPVILGPDGPSLGGFVCPVTITRDELWKIGQLRAGDTLRFHSRTPDGTRNAILAVREGAARMVFRRAGDRYLLVEYGAAELDIATRLRVHVLMQAVQQSEVDGIIDITPGIRSLQIHFDPDRITLDRLLALLHDADAALPPTDQLEIPSRVVHLPLSWDDPATRLAIERYARSVRADAPWCPSNIEFIRRINGLDSIEDVRRIVFDARYLVLGLGDVYLGAPVATPVDPRHRLVTTKYNPARTWTPENAVGIGGAYLCIYGMEGPGGYQFVGRTCQVWNSHRKTREFTEGHPWLLRFFDRIRFYEVSAAELENFRAALPHGGVSLEIEEGSFRLADYRAFLAANAAGIGAFKSRQQAAFEAERARWQTMDAPEEAAYAEPVAAAPLPPGHLAVASPVTGNVWKLHAAPGDRVRAGDLLVAVESMKVEIAVTAPADGIVQALSCAEGQLVRQGQPLIVLSTRA